MKVVKVGLLLLTTATTHGQLGYEYFGFFPQGQPEFGYAGFGPQGFGGFGYPGVGQQGFGEFGYAGVGQQGFGGRRFGGQRFVQSRLPQRQFSQTVTRAGIDNPGISQPKPMSDQENSINSQSGQQSVSPGLLSFVQQGFAVRGVGQGFGEDLGVSTFDQPGVGRDAFGNPTLSGVRVAGADNKPVEASSSSTCRQWCKGAVREQFYCCEENTEPITVPIVKSGACPPRRRSCPDKPRQSRSCSDDGKCPGSERCCFDGCLKRHVCARPIV